MSIEEFIEEWANGESYVNVQTSGSTGRPKPMQAEKQRMAASARITCQFLGLKEGDSALLCLPLDYIAGKMMVVRALTCGLQLFATEPSSHPLKAAPSLVEKSRPPMKKSRPFLKKSRPPIKKSRPRSEKSRADFFMGGLDFAAMVPMQVWNSLQVPEERASLQAIRHLIIGGGAIDDALARELKDFPNAVWSTYGMTETLSHIALRRLSGPDATDWYTPFEGVSLSLSDDGCLVIDAPEVCAERLVTNDLAELCPDGRFRILGRRDNVVCSGGIKIQMEEVERLLRPHLSVPFCATKVPDQQLGEALVLLVEGMQQDSLTTLCKQVLPRLWRPRHIASVSHVPTTETGKIARQQAQELACRGNLNLLK